MEALQESLGEAVSDRSTPNLSSDDLAQMLVKLTADLIPDREVESTPI